jgi:hypothetical protein
VCASKIKVLDQGLLGKEDTDEGLKRRLAQLRSEKAGHKKLARLRELLLGLGGLLLAGYLWQYDWSRYEIMCIARILRKQVEPFHKETHVPRPEEEGLIAEMIGVPSCWYDVVTGPRGCGKSSVVFNAAAG